MSTNIMHHKIQVSLLKDIRKNVTEKQLTHILIAIKNSCEEKVILHDIIIALYDAGCEQYD